MSARTAHAGTLRMPRPGTARPVPDGHAVTPRPSDRPRRGRALRAHLGTIAGVVILAVLLWRLGTGVFLDGLRRIDAFTLVAAVGIGLVTTAFSAWRWQLVARGLRIRLPFGPAVADYYRALFLNAALPGGVLGDVHRAVRHGRSAGDLGRGVRSVVLERTAGQAVLAVAGVAVLLTVPSPVMAGARHVAVLLAFAALGALAIVLALRMNRTSATRRRALLDEAREALLSRRNGPGVVGSSVVVLAGYVAMFLLAARVAGTSASVTVLLPLAVLALLAMSLPLNVGGWGPREGVTAWAFGAAGLGAGNGLAVAVVYGVLSFVASLPGALVLVARWYAGLRAGSATLAPDAEPGHTPDGDYPRSPPAGADGEVSTLKYAPNESARLASSSFPFSAAPSEGRPMTPESV
ncbi:lysylphosphatidylglycerol synthase transmembrane domain-containing protein [Streptomyces sp. KR55]|uniref:lysylphosphatidylglycerol synthase transmembrane domain-containing protein n=1 Tax=Streptomyces sp. KR55 TaxID=3457425 RepID=UPI003FD5E1D9